MDEILAVLPDGWSLTATPYYWKGVRSSISYIEIRNATAERVYWFKYVKGDKVGFYVNRITDIASLVDS